MLNGRNLSATPFAMLVGRVPRLLEKLVAHKVILRVLRNMTVFASLSVRRNMKKPLARKIIGIWTTVLGNATGRKHC